MHGLQEGQLVHGHRDAEGAGVPDRRERRRRVGETHHDAAVDVAGDVRVGDLHELCKRHPRVRCRPGLQPVFVLHDGES